MDSRTNSPMRFGSSGRYSSKRDWWLSLVIWGSVAACVYASVDFMEQNGETIATALFALFMVLAIGFMGWIYLDTWYRIDRRELHARCGPFRHTIKLRDIGSVVPTRSPLSSMALSLDRLAVRNRRGIMVMMISPKDQETFLRHLASLDRGLEFVDGEVHRQ